MCTAPPIAFVGAATLDGIALVHRLPRSDERLLAEDVIYAGGGPAATAAVTAARLGLPAAFVGTVGDDDVGLRILAGLQAEGVDTKGARTQTGVRSGASVVIVDNVHHARAICTRPGLPPIVVGAAERLVRSAPWVHVDQLGWGPTWAVLRDLPMRDRPYISVDAGNPIDGLASAHVELLVPTLSALADRFGQSDVDWLLDAALAEGVHRIVATRGPLGCVAATAEGHRYVAPAHDVEVVSTLGAGDVFHGALLAAIVRGRSLPDCLSYANVAAALSCRGLDGRSAIPTHDEVLAELDPYPAIVTARRRSGRNRDTHRWSS